MRDPLRVIVFGGLGLALLGGACGEDPYGQPPGDDEPPIDSGPRPDADPLAPDAPRLPPDALGDATAPRITFVMPAPEQLIRGTLRLLIMVDDADGIAEVRATIAGAHDIPMFAQGGGMYAGEFDTFVLTGLVFPNVVVYARDLAGDENEEGIVIALDNRAPLSSLDPPRVREGQLNSSNELECSASFDPVGPDAPSDGESVAQLVEFRARVFELGNIGTTSSTVFVPKSTIETVELFVLDDSTRPLIVDSNGDGVCDRINPQVLPQSGQDDDGVPNAAVVTLAGISGAGTSNMSPNGFDPYGGTNANVCVTGQDEDPPPGMCASANGFTRAIVDPVYKTPQIFTIPPITELACVGLAFDVLASNVSDGWACAALRVADAKGNVGISPVMRVCVDADGDRAECGAWGTIAPANQRPNCTGTLSGGVVTVTPCSAPPTFTSSGVSGDYEIVRTDL